MDMSVGVDLVDVARLERLLAGIPGNAMGVFTARELTYCGGKKRRSEHLAARFAAKEAVLKAIGTGLGPRMRWTDVEVVNDVFGRPHVKLSGEVATAARRKGLGEITISMSHSGGMAIAQAVALSPSPTSSST
jgi:holo-[acyl-carrier protein] synthase